MCVQISFILQCSSAEAVVCDLKFFSQDVVEVMFPGLLYFTIDTGTKGDAVANAGNVTFAFDDAGSWRQFYQCSEDDSSKIHIIFFFPLYVVFEVRAELIQ